MFFADAPLCRWDNGLRWWRSLRAATIAIGIGHCHGSHRHVCVYRARRRDNGAWPATTIVSKGAPRVVCVARA